MDIFEAIQKGETSAVSSLLDRDPSLVNATRNGVSAVLWALYHGRTEVAQTLVERGAELSFWDACALGNRERVEALLNEDPALLDRRSPDGFPPVGLAIFFRQPDVARLLIERGADVSAHADNAARVAPVHAAAAVRDRETMALLLARGADPNAKQQNDFTALHSAASRGDVEMAQLLLKHGADRNARTADGLGLAEIAEKYGQREFSDWLRQT